MKKTAYLLMFAAILVSSAVGQSSQNLIAYYPFSGNAFDESGNGLNGTVSGPTLTTDRNGISNSAYSFDGDDDYIQISDSELLNPESGVIVEAWINPTSLPSSEFGYGNKQIVMKESEYSLTLYADGRVSFGIGPFPWVHAYTLAAVPLSAWSHIRGEYDRR
ncbi:MAG: LamG domain-containing protein, partial [candidate division Zixibacteria bacterium]|nr:LamG domain-containing protein [candidate division Zixibacteria bacterium]